MYAFGITSYLTINLEVSSILGSDSKLGALAMLLLVSEEPINVAILLSLYESRDADGGKLPAYS